MNKKIAIVTLVGFLLILQATPIELRAKSSIPLNVKKYLPARVTITLGVAGFCSGAVLASLVRCIHEGSVSLLILEYVFLGAGIGYYFDIANNPEALSKRLNEMEPVLLQIMDNFLTKFIEKHQKQMLIRELLEKKSSEEISLEYWRNHHSDVEALVSSFAQYFDEDEELENYSFSVSRKIAKELRAIVNYIRVVSENVSSGLLDWRSEKCHMQYSNYLQKLIYPLETLREPMLSLATYLKSSEGFNKNRCHNPSSSD